MIKHLILDVDGVLTTGQIFYTADGKAMKVFGPHDKDGIKIIRQLGISIAFITADLTGWDITEARLRDWGFTKDDLHYVSEESRFEWFNSNYNLEEVAFIGDGYHDAPILRVVRLGIAPKNARKEAKAAADYITETNSGEGAVLDACLYIQDYYRVHKERC